MSYSPLGNIASKTGIGTYTYGAGAGPHAVTSIAGSLNGVSNPSFTYDSNGNMTADAGRTVTYMSFNMADTVTQGSCSYSFTYDDANQRFRQLQTDRQWQQIGAQVRKGERGSMVVFYKRLETTNAEPDDHDQNTGLRFVVRASHVFNTVQVDGYTRELTQPQSAFEKIREVEAFVGAVGAVVQHGLALGAALLSAAA
jgi:N-terminal domain of anti-restriction factor ArdC